MLRGDFHLHSNFSDGLHPPAVVIRKAARAGISILALTDHDITDGCSEAIHEGAASGVTVLCGVELSVTHEGREFHMLGLGLDPEEPTLQTMLEGVREARSNRGAAIVERIAAAGAPITLDRVLEIAGEGSIGRPHVAHALVEGGWATSVEDAFDRWLSRGRPGYVRIDYLSAGEGIELVRAAGGITSLAHPTLYRDGGSLAVSLAAMGLDAIETVHPDVSPSDERRFRELADEHGLIVTGGSDDHGFEGKNHLGKSFLSGEDLDRLLQRISDRSHR